MKNNGTWIAQRRTKNHRIHPHGCQKHHCASYAGFLHFQVVFQAGSEKKTQNSQQTLDGKMPKNI